jgi:hypothetical protein
MRFSNLTYLVHTVPVAKLHISDADREDTHTRADTEIFNGLWYLVIKWIKNVMDKDFIFQLVYCLINLTVYWIATERVYSSWIPFRLLSYHIVEFLCLTDVIT